MWYILINYILKKARYPCGNSWDFKKAEAQFGLSSTSSNLRHSL